MTMLAAMAVGLTLQQSMLQPAASLPTREENGVTLVGYQVDCSPFAKEFGRFPWCPVERPQIGQSEIRLRGASAAPGRYWLSDNALMAPGLQPSGQIVRVVAASGETLTLDEPVAIGFRGEARLVAAPISVDVELKDGSGPISVGLTDGFSVRNWTVPAHWDRFGLARAISIQSSRHGRLEGIEVGPSEKGSAGLGYACQIQRSLDITVQDLTAQKVRHAGNVFGGAKVTFRNCRAIETVGDGFETHGYGGREIRFERCDFGGSNASIGNKYPWGDQDVEILDSRNVKTLFLNGSTEKVGAKRTRFGGPLMLVTNEAGRPKSAAFERCTFVGFLDDGDPTSAGVRFVGNGGIDQLRLTDCIVNDFAGTHARALYLGKVDYPTEIVIDGGTLGEASGDYAIEINNDGRGQVTLVALRSPTFKFRLKASRVRGSRESVVTGIGG